MMLRQMNVMMRLALQRWALSRPSSRSSVLWHCPLTGTNASKNRQQMLRFQISGWTTQARGTLLLNTQSNLKCWVEDACSIVFIRFTCKYRFDQCELGAEVHAPSCKKEDTYRHTYFRFGKGIECQTMRWKAHWGILRNVNGVNISRASQTWTPRMYRYIVKPC